MSDTQATGGQPAGWYPEPGTGRLRWWDGTQWGAYQDAGATPVPGGQPAGVNTGDPKTMAMLCHVLGIFTGFIGPLIIYATQGEKDPFVKHHAAEALNFQITLMIAYIVSFVLMIVLIGILTFFLAWIGGLALCIMASLAANKGEWYRYPINIRMVSGAQG